MFEVECPKPAYDRLVRVGLEARILEVRNKIADILLSVSPTDSELAGHILDKAREFVSGNYHERLTPREILYRDISDLEVYARDNDLRADIEASERSLMQFPSLLAFVVLCEEVLNHKKYGFATRRQLEESIASFCLGEKPRIFSWEPYYQWRTGNSKNVLSNHDRGDLSISQIDVSGLDYSQDTLFGAEEVFDTFKEVKEPDHIKRIHASDYNWTTFLMINLRYAQYLGKSDILEIVEWRRALEEVGSVGTFTAEAEFGDPGADLNLSAVVKAVLLPKERNTLGSLLLSIRDGKVVYHPYVADGNLTYLREDPNGEVELSFIKGQLAEKFSPHIIHTEADLPELLKGIYRLFARDRRVLPKAMQMFLGRD